MQGPIRSSFARGHGSCLTHEDTRILEQPRENAVHRAVLYVGRSQTQQQQHHRTQVRHTHSGAYTSAGSDLPSLPTKKGVAEVTRTTEVQAQRGRRGCQAPTRPTGN